MSTSSVASLSFLDALRKSKLLETEKLNQLLDKYPGLHEDSSRLSKFLISEQAITEFQAKFLLTGRYRGLTVGPYSIQKKIGSGGMGIVYLAEHRKMGRKVAVKILQEDHISDKLALERFYREARSVATLDHPNIVKAHDVNEDHGVHYLVMEYVNGITLDKYLQIKGSISWKTVLNIVMQVCRGLQHAHERNFVHRDIKPANLLIDKNGQVKILDLGLARSLEKKRDNLTADLSNGNDVQGSIDYVSPEQAFGNGMVDIRADLYSLGATAYVLLTGQPVVHGTAAQKLLEHQLKLPTPPHELKPGVSRAFSEVIMKMLAKRPDHRYDTPADVNNALKQFLAPVGGTMMNSAIVEAFALPEDEIPSTQFDTTRVSQNSEVTRKVRKGHTRRFSKKKKSSGNGAKVAVLAACLLFLAGICWAGYAFFGKASVAPNGENLALQDIATPDNNRPADGPPRRFVPQAATSTNTISLHVGQRLPDIVGEDLQNANIRLADFDGKVVLLSFWGFWSPQCVKMFNHEKTIVLRYKNRPFVLLGVNNDKDEFDITRGMQQHQVSWRSFRDKLPDGKLISTMIGVKASPTLILVDHRGLIQKTWVGTPVAKEVDDMIENLVKKAEPPVKYSDR